MQGVWRQESKITGKGTPSCYRCWSAWLSWLHILWLGWWIAWHYGRRRVCSCHHPKAWYFRKKRSRFSCHQGNQSPLSFDKSDHYNQTSWWKRVFNCYCSWI